MADPQDEALVLPLNLFEKGGAAPGDLNPNFRDLLLKLMAVLVFPTIQPSSIRADSLSGFCSAARKTMLVCWTLRTWQDDVRPPVVDTVTERV